MATNAPSATQGRPQDKAVRRRVFAIRGWLVLAVAASSLVIASGAQAQLFGGDNGRGHASGAYGGFLPGRSGPVAGPVAGFNWDYAVTGIGLLIAVAGVGIVYLGRNRRRPNAPLPGGAPS